MKKDAIISISGKNGLGFADECDVELVTSGSFYRTNGDYFICYKESALTGLEGTTTTVKIEGKRVILVRYGCVSTHQVFEQGTKHFSYYDTEIGSMTVGVSARKVRAALTDSGGELEIDYSVEVDHTVTGESAFKISVRTVPS